MTRVGQLIGVCAIAACVSAAAASAASAETFLVDEHLGSKGNSCTEKLPCPTIKEAIERSEAAPGPNTIEVRSSDEPAYKESLALNSVKDSGLTIEGVEKEVAVVNTGAPVMTVNAIAGTVTIANIKMEDQSGTHAVIDDHGAGLTLDNDEVDNQSPSGVNGVEAEHGTLAIDGGKVVMANGASSYAVETLETPLSLNGVTVTDENTAEAGGILSRKSTLSIQSSHVDVESGLKEEDVGIIARDDTSALLQGDSVQEEGVALGAAFEASPTTVDGLTVKMGDPTSKVEAVATSVAPATFDHLDISGSWQGPPLLGLGGNVTLSDSRLTATPAGGSPALDFVGSTERAALVVQRSVLEAADKAVPGSLEAINANVTVDSSDIFGGTDGVSFKTEAEGTRSLTLASSNVSAPPGLGLELPGVVGVNAEALGKHASVANVLIEGSILIPSQLATAAAGDQATVSCSYSAVPSQIQTADGASHAGQINCASGTTGNTNSSTEFTSLFPEHLKSYVLSPTSSAVDSVPVGAITLPFGLTPSATDLEGNPRFESVACNLVQDKGALELPGHSSPCPVAIPIGAPQPLKASAGVISRLSVSPSAFLPAPSGATISAKHKAKKKYGAKIGYADSQAAITTFAVLRKTSGRKQGRGCRKPSRKNKHGKRCTLLVKVGTFTHTDKAGANSFHFSGRIKGKKLPAGSYELQAIAHDAAGNGPAVTKNFTVK